jgi:hypothetical protein
MTVNAGRTQPTGARRLRKFLHPGVMPINHTATPFVTFPVRSALTACLLWSLAAAVPARAADPATTEEALLVNWWYSATFGTGFYKVNGTTATVIRLPIAVDLPSGDGIFSNATLLLPVSIGAYHLNLNEYQQFRLSDDVATISFLPGVEWNVAMNEIWYAKPFAQVGVGSEFHHHTTAYLYTAGVRNHFAVYDNGSFEVNLGATLLGAGYRLKGGEEQGLASFQTGVDVGFPWWPTVWGQPSRFHAHVIYYSYFSRLAFDGDNPNELKIRREGEVGASLKFSPKASLFGFPVSGAGLGVRFADRLTGIHLVNEFPF